MAAEAMYAWGNQSLPTWARKQGIAGCKERSHGYAGEKRMNPQKQKRPRFSCLHAQQMGQALPAVAVVCAESSRLSHRSAAREKRSSWAVLSSSAKPEIATPRRRTPRRSASVRCSSFRAMSNTGGAEFRYRRAGYDTGDSTWTDENLAANQSLLIRF